MDIFAVLERAADPKEAAGMAAYMRDQFAFLGIKKPERAALTKAFFAEKKQQLMDWDFVEQCYAREEREFQYLAVGYVQLMADKLTLEDLERIESLITRKSWWDTVDSLTGAVGRIYIQYPQSTGKIRQWMSSGNMWLRRMSIIFQLGCKQQTDTAMLREAIEKNLGSKEFFINKAIGWALREYSKTDPDWVRAFVETHTLSPLSKREGSKYI